MVAHLIHSILDHFQSLLATEETDDLTRKAPVDMLIN